MNKRGWYIPFMIVAANALAIILQWNSLQEILPAHFDLEGNAGGILLAAVAGFVVCVIRARSTSF